ncbi:MAG: hypothetical protein IPO98_21905 [Saprospiraceae bacterium]|nr:hypothetical protein [Saprospiraceae bacterium]
MVVLGMEDQELKAGEEAELAVMAGNFSDIAGFQYTMNLKGANYVGSDREH